MDSFLNYYERYCYASLWLVIRRVYCNTTSIHRVLLWISTALLFGLSCYYFISGVNHLWFLLVAASYVFWLYCYMAALKSVFADYYRRFPKQIRNYGKHHQYIRFLIFHDDVLSTFRGDIDDAIKYLEIQLSTETHNPISIHPVGSAIVATAISIVGSSVNYKELDTIVAVLFGLAIFWFWLWAYSSSTRTSTAKLKECLKFLLWLKESR